MSYTALYRKYRPNSFKNVVGQDIIVQILINSIINNHISHAYLFTGPRGTGKTSMAKIFARAVNCQNFSNDVCNECEICKKNLNNDMDIIEIDAASNNGVDEIRTLRDNVKLMPSFSKYKVYIIDEVHMLSQGAFNALLKTLEEPPSHIIFILATTDPNKLPSTIISRCQRFDFQRINNSVIVNRLKYIMEQENKNIAEDVLFHIAELSDGGLRDSINLLDQSFALNDENMLESLDKLCGIVPNSVIVSLFESLFCLDKSSLFDKLEFISSNNYNYIEIVYLMLSFVRKIFIGKYNSNCKSNTNEELILKISDDNILLVSKMLNELLYELKKSNNQKVMFDIYLINISNKLSLSNSKINSNKLAAKIETEIFNEESKNNDFQFNNLRFNKEVRINNTLALANKDSLNEIREIYKLLNDYISDKKLNYLINLIDNTEIVASSPDYSIIASESINNAKNINENAKKIEELIEKKSNKKIKIVCISFTEWLNIKNKYINDLKNNIKYVIINEEENVSEISKSNKDTDVSDLFGEEIITIE